MKYEINAVKTGKYTTEYVKFGSGEKNLVVLPGLGLKSITASADYLSGIFNEYKREYTVYIFDRRDILEEGMTVEDFADDIYYAFKELNIWNADIYGTSFGAMIEMSLISKYEGAARAAVLASTASCHDNTDMSILNEWEDFALKGDVKGFNHSIFNAIYTKKFLEKAGDAICELEKEGSKEELERVLIQIRAIKNFDISDKLYLISCPLYVIGAEKDRLFSAAASLYIAEKTGAKLEIVSGYEHAFYDELPGFLGKVVGFFRSTK